MTIGARTWTKRTMPGVRDNTYGQKYKVGSHLLCPGTPIQGLPRPSSYLLSCYPDHPPPPITLSSQNLSSPCTLSSSLTINLVELGEAGPQVWPVEAHLCSRWLLSSWMHCSCQGVRGWVQSTGFRL